MLATLRQKLIADLGFIAIGPGHGASDTGYLVALAAFREGLFAAHWENPILTIECFYTKAVAVAALADFIRTNLPWEGRLITVTDDMGEA